MSDQATERKIKLLELICNTIPADLPGTEADQIILFEQDFERANLRFDEAYLQLSDFEKEHWIFELRRSYSNEPDAFAGDMPLMGWQAFFYTGAFIRGALDELRDGIKSGSVIAIFDKGVLHIGSEAILISERNKKTRAEYILEYLFAQKDPSEQHFYAEIGEEIFSDEPHDPRSYYRACSALSEKILKATGVRDFLTFNSGAKGWVRISPRYLKKT